MRVTIPLPAERRRADYDVPPVRSRREGGNGLGLRAQMTLALVTAIVITSIVEQGGQRGKIALPFIFRVTFIFSGPMTR